MVCPKAKIVDDFCGFLSLDRSGIFKRKKVGTIFDYCLVESMQRVSPVSLLWKPKCILWTYRTKSCFYIV